MADTSTPARAKPPATLNRDDITARLRNAETTRADAYFRYVNTPCGPTDPVVRDAAGRTPQDSYHYWCGMADACSAMLAELDARERRS